MPIHAPEQPSSRHSSRARFSLRKRLTAIGLGAVLLSGVAVAEADAAIVEAGSDIVEDVTPGELDPFDISVGASDAGELSNDSPAGYDSGYDDAEDWDVEWGWGGDAGGVTLGDPLPLDQGSLPECPQYVVTSASSPFGLFALTWANTNTEWSAGSSPASTSIDSNLYNGRCGNPWPGGTQFSVRWNLDSQNGPLFDTATATDQPWLGSTQLLTPDLAGRLLYSTIQVVTADGRTETITISTLIAGSWAIDFASTGSNPIAGDTLTVVPTGWQVPGPRFQFGLGPYTSYGVDPSQAWLIQCPGNASTRIAVGSSHVVQPYDNGCTIVVQVTLWDTQFSTTQPSTAGVQGRFASLEIIDSFTLQVVVSDPDLPLSTTEKVLPRGGSGAAVTGTGEITVWGWAYDSDDPGVTPIQVVLNGAVVAQITANGPSPSVSTAIGVSGNFGFSTIIKAPYGTNQVCVFAINLPSWQNNQSLGCHTLSLADLVPTGGAGAKATSPNQITVWGWAADLDVISKANGAGVPVQIVVNNQVVAQVIANQPSPAVSAAIGRTGDFGFSTTLSVQPGVKQVCVFALNLPSMQNNQLLGCQSVTVVDPPPTGGVGIVASSANQITVWGWAADPDVVSSAGGTGVPIQVVVNNKITSQLTANQPSAAVSAAIGRTGDFGFSTVLTVAPGTYQVCVFAINLPSAYGNQSLGCRSVNVVDSPPVGGVGVSATSASRVTVWGWAADPDISSAIGGSGVPIQIVVNNQMVKQVTANESSAAVAAAIGRTGDFGFSANIPVQPGANQVCVFALNLPSLQNNQLLGCRTVTS